MWSIDLFATALDAAGLPMPQDKPLDGTSILPAIKGKTNKLHNELYWSSAGAKGKWAIRSGDWKLVAEKNRIELFDLQKISAKPPTLLQNTHRWFPNSRTNTTPGSTKWQTR